MSAKRRRRRRKRSTYTDYESYLGSQAWRTKRRGVMIRDGHRCPCGRTATQVHHRTYHRLFREWLIDLVAVCDDCHAEIHRRHEHGTISLERATQQVLGVPAINDGPEVPDALGEWRREAERQAQRPSPRMRAEPVVPPRG